MSSDRMKSTKIRPTCKLCNHKPFRHQSGLDWHLQHIHPVEYTAMTNRPTSEFTNGTPPDPDPVSEPVHIHQDLDLKPKAIPKPLPPQQPMSADHDPLECDHEGCDGRGNARLRRYVQAILAHHCRRNRRCLSHSPEAVRQRQSIPAGSHIRPSHYLSSEQPTPGPHPPARRNHCPCRRGPRANSDVFRRRCRRSRRYWSHIPAPGNPTTGDWPGCRTHRRLDLGNRR